MERDDVLDKVKRLLALATSPNENEAKAALAKAHELLAGHNLSMAEAESFTSDRGRVIDDTVEDLGEFNRNLPRHVWPVLGVLDACYFVRHFVEGCERFDERRQRWGYWNKVKLFGEAGNVAVATEIYRFLCRVFVDLWQQRRRAGIADMTSYFNGLAAGVIKRINEDRSLYSPRQQNALVVLSNHLTQRFKNKHKLKYVRTGQTKDHDAFYQGLRDGKQINVPNARPNQITAKKQIGVN